MTTIVSTCTIPDPCQAHDKQIWVLSDFSWIMQNQYPFCKLASFVKDRGWHQDPDVAMAQVIALASAELEIESDIKECSSYFQKHLGMMPTEMFKDDFNTRYPYEKKPISSFYEKDIKILPPALLLKDIEDASPSL